MSKVIDFFGNVIEDSQQEETNIPEFQQEMLNAIDEFEQRAYKQNLLSFTSGFPGLDHALEGIQPGFHILAGDSNVGKSAFMIQLGWQLALNNNVYVIHYSLDDPAFETIARVIASMSRVPINAVKNPKKFENNPNVLKRREAGIKKLREMSDRYKIRDATFTQYIEVIEEDIRKHKIMLEEEGKGKKLIVIIDNFHDLDTQKKYSEGSKFDVIAQIVSDMATKYQIPILCTAEFRKINSYRRPTIDDIRENVKIKYEAKSIMLAYNEVSLKQEGAVIYFEREGTTTKQPILEIKIAKNKYSSYKGTIFFEFYPEIAYFIQVDDERARRYMDLIYSNA